MAFVKKGDVESARKEYAKLGPLRVATDVIFLDTVSYPATELLEIADFLVQGEIAMENGELAAAIAWFEKAVRIQDALPYTEPPFWYYPTRHALGKALLSIGRPAEAEIVYRRDLELYPRNCWAMQGLIQSLHEQDRNASDIQAKFDVIWAQADIT